MLYTVRARIYTPGLHLQMFLAAVTRDDATEPRSGRVKD